MYTLSTGKASPDPEGRPLAARLGKRRYATPQNCDNCKICQARNTASGRCAACTTRIAELVRYMAFTDEVTLQVAPIPDYLEGIIPTWDAIEAFHAIKADPTFRLHPTPCKQYGHIRITNDKHPTCYFCDINGNAQEQAVKEGNDEYVTRSKCGGCGETTLRRTKDASCTECGHEPVRGRGRSTASETEMLMSLAPDMVITRGEAIELGYNVYRTGKECLNGHTGWRYVKTGNCLDCRKEK